MFEDIYKVQGGGGENNLDYEEDQEEEKNVGGEDLEEEGMDKEEEDWDSEDYADYGPEMEFVKGERRLSRNEVDFAEYFEFE